MAKVKRQVIKIDGQLCNGCGSCVPACAEGAIQIIDGKAKMISDRYCDGLGACLGDCPTGAITFEEREAEEFDEAAVAVHLKEIGREVKPHAHDHLAAAHAQAEPAAPAPMHHHAGGGCPSARTLDFRRDEESKPSGNGGAPKLESELRQWPIKLHLVSPSAPYFQDADLLIAADCTPFAYASLHPDFLAGKAVVIGCPKFDDLQEYMDKLTAIISRNNVKSVTVLHMEVPCCFGMMQAARQAVAASGKDIPITAKVVTLQGEIKEPVGAASLF